MRASRWRITARFAYRGAPQRRWVLVSGAVHLAAVVVLVLAGGSARIEPPEGFVAELMDALPRAGAASASASSPNQPAPTAAPPAQSVPSPPAPLPLPLPEKPEPKTEPKTEPKPKEPPRSKPTASPASDAAADPETPGPAAPGSSATAHVGDAGGTVAAVVMGGTEFDWYRNAVSGALFSQWRKPPLDAQREPLEALVSFEIEADGRVSNVRLESSSGVPSLDRSALRAVTDAAPLPPLPRNWRGTTLPAAFIFRLLPEEP